MSNGLDRLDAVLARQQADLDFVRNVTAWRTLSSRQAQTTAWPVALDPRLPKAAATLGIAQLYTHQAAAIEAALRGEDVVMATGTASGKSLGYILPVLHALLQDPRATALLLYPTKALAHDQMTAISQWIGALNAPIALRAYDGDTPQRLRAGIRKEARILISNPDMVHLGILPHHTQWLRFFRGLRYVVLDELHIYRGVFGSHVANVLRRLRRIAEFYGVGLADEGLADKGLADKGIQYLAASATIGNPGELAEVLWERPVTAMDNDGAAYGQRHVLFYNPPLLNPTLGLRASATDEALKLATRLLQAGVQTIIFARSRLSVELLLREMRSRATQLGFDAEVVQGYRGGYLPQERRAIEVGLRQGRVRVVVATNALELGIDIGALDASILVGYPGTIAGARQQMGRAGRRAGTSLSVMVATPDPLDQYLVAHPEYFFGRSPEEARANPDALSLLAAHVTCAAFELPFQRGERFGRHGDVDALLEALAAEGVLHAGQAQSPDRAREQFTWVGETYPAQTVSLRSSIADNVIVRSAETGVIGTVDRPSAPLLVHEGAIYFHGAESFLIESLDWEQGIALARPADLDYYTVASASTKVERLKLRRRKPVDEGYVHGLALSDEEVIVHIKPAAYRRVHLDSHETLGWGEIHLPEQQMETEAFRLTLDAAVVESLADEGVMVAPLDYGPEWPLIRAQILSRDGESCRLCGRLAEPGRPLEVHHITPVRTFMARYPRSVALRLAHAPENLLTLCSVCHQQVERARGARTALGGLAYLLKHLVPAFLMCDPGDLGTSVEARDDVTGQPSIIVYDGVPGGVGLSPRLVDLWPRVASAALERAETCPCLDGCPSCVGPTGESEPGAKPATIRLLRQVRRPDDL